MPPPPAGAEVPSVALFENDEFLIPTWALSPRMLMPPPAPALVLFVTVTFWIVTVLRAGATSSMLMPPPDPLALKLLLNTEFEMDKVLSAKPHQSSPAPLVAGVPTDWVLRPKRTVTPE